MRDPINPEDLNPFEQAVLDEMARGHAQEAVLRAQLANARVTSRTWTGFGFCTGLEAPRDTVRPLEPGRPMGSSWAHVKGLEQGMSFLLWTDDEGVISRLEGVALAGEVDAAVLAGAAIEFYDVPEAGFSGFQPPPPSWAR